MSKVFKTKYLASVNNDKLPIYGKIRIGINVSAPMSIGLYQGDGPIDAIGGNFLQNDLSTIIGSHIDNLNGDMNVTSDVSGILINRYGLGGNIYFSNIKANYDVDISEFRYSKLSTLQLTGKGVTGDISSLSSMTHLIRVLGIKNTNVTGDISSLSSMTQLTSMTINDCDLTGDISSFSSMTQLTTLNVAGTKVTGDISSIVNNLTSLKVLGIPPAITITDEQKTTLTNRGCTVTIR